MKRPNLTSKIRIWLFTLPLTALALAVATGIWLRHQQGKRLNSIAAVKTASEERASEQHPGRLNQSLLTDAILSIVQSYYVDPVRVDNESLLRTALSSITVNPRVRASLSPIGIELAIDGESRTIPLSSDLKYQDILKAFVEIATFLDDKGVEIAAGEAPEKGAHGTVKLLNSMLAELDAHSSLLSPEAYMELRQGTEGSFGGLGVLVGIRDNQLTVIKPLPRSPALRAGIKKRDRILGIDGVFTYGFTLDELVEYMRGDPGTDVHLSLLRDGAAAPAELILKREVIHVDSVQAQDIVVKNPKLKVLHLIIENFSSRTSREVLSAIKKARMRHDGILHGLILDLRSNPGGLLDQAVQVADLFLPSGVIVTTKGRREEVESAGSGIDETSYPIAVLINGDSASASEIVAGALQDHGRGIVIGQPSFGKGSVQTIFELPGERALKLTIARYYTPAGRSIQNVGIVPDIWLQPVLKSDRNDNLFGPYRYKNERFLRNHLENIAASNADASLMNQSVNFVPARKAYYLVPAMSEEDQGTSDRPEQDREMELALQLIDKVHATYGDRLPDSAGRASHWLGLAGPQIASYAERLDSEVRTWLASAHRVAWTQKSQSQTVAALDLELDKSNPTLALPGDELSIRWKLTNPQDKAIDRVSVFVRSDNPGLETREILVGSVPAGESRSGSIAVPIPAHLDPGSLLLRVSAAVDAWPAPNAVADLLLEIKDRPVAEFLAETELIDEQGGAIEGAIEQSERAKLKIKLRNIGNAAARDTSLRLFNLAGQQLAVSPGPIPLGVIESGAAHEIRINLSAARAIYSKELGLGLYVESSDLRQSFQQRVSLSAVPSLPRAPTRQPSADKEVIDQSRMSNLLGH